VELQSDFDNICEQYLLGELSESECQQMEEAYFGDDSLFERFLDVKNDLLDAYARGDLTGHKLERFEQHYLASEARRQRVEEARELIQVASAAATGVAPGETESTHFQKRHHYSGWQWLNFSLHPVALRVGLVGAMLVIIAGAWIVGRRIQDWNASRTAEERDNTKPADKEINNGSPPVGPSPTSGLNVGGERATSSPSPSLGAKPEIAAKPPRSTSAQIASLTLLPVSSRDTSRADSLIINPEVRVVRLSLAFSGAPYDSFEASLRTVDGQQVIRRGGLKASANGTGKTVTITFDSSLLRRQDYIATLSGRLKNGKPETIGDYYFRVEHFRR
jgi:hypothetical protein